MSRVRVHNFSVSLDGFGTGDGQSLEAPFGHAGTRLHQWFFATRTFREMQGEPGGSTGVDDAFASQWASGVGAEIMGRNKFGPQRGPWVDEEWRGWWGDDPPFHSPVFVLTHHPRPLIDDGRRHHVPLHRRHRRGSTAGGPGGRRLASTSASAEDPRPSVNSSPRTSSTTCTSSIVPILLGRGERLWDGFEELEERFDVESVSSPSGVTHLTFTRPAV